jgi:ribonuclease-3
LDIKDSMDHLCRKLGYRFDDKELLKIALTHRSAGNRNNERLEFLGDAILGFVIADRLYRYFPEADEGQLSRLRAVLVKKESLAEVARVLELGNYLNLGPGELRGGGHSRDSILADSLEALLAAIYLDNGYETVRTVILRLFEDRVENLSPDDQLKDPKTGLQEFLQGRGLSLPAYEIAQVTGEQHEQTFIVTCTIPDLGIEATGRGGSRRKAEQAAAAQLLKTLSDG